MANDKQQKLFAKEQLYCMLSPWIKESCSLARVICQSLAVAQQLIQQASSTHYSHILLWLKRSLSLVQHFINPNEQSIVEPHGNQKVIKASLKFISSFAEVQKTKDIFEGTDSCTVNQLFHGVVVTLLQLIESSESSATVISSSLKTFGKVLEVARPEFITELFSCETKSEEVPRKQARLDHSSSCETVQEKATVKAANSEKLAFVLYRRLRDSRWEVKDSTLEFLASLLQVNNDSVHDFLCRHSVHVVVWNAIDDTTDSYVRASAIHVIGSLACQSQLWTSLLQTGHVTEESILEKFSSILENDDEAFPRRRAMECLTLWLKTRHPMAARILRPDKSCHPDLTDTVMDSKGSPTTGINEELSTVEDAANKTLPEGVGRQSEVVGGQSEGTKTPSEYGMARSVCHACQDFDWEVKLRGLKFWEAVIDFFTEFKNNKESTSLRGKANDDESMKAGNVDELFRVLFNMGALNILSEALDDCDHMVCEKTLEILTGLQGIANPEKIVIEQSVKTPWEYQEFLGNGFGLEKFKEVLRMTDFPAMIQSTEAADSAVRSDPVSLIEDLLMAATRQDENLLDCY